MSDSYQKFKLLLWKNWRLQWNHKLGMLVEIFLPVLFTFCLVWIRTLILPRYWNETIYKNEFSLDTLDYTRFFIHRKEQIGINHKKFQSELLPRESTGKKLQWHMDYSPQNEIFDQIVADAAKVLRLTYSAHKDAKALENKLTKENIFIGVEFPDKQAGITTYPRHLHFNLRFPSELRTTIDPYVYTWMTNLLFSPEDAMGPRYRNFSDGGVVHYYREGFLSVQHRLSIAYIKQASGTSTKLPAVKLKRYPYPEVVNDLLLANLGPTLVLIFLLSYIYPATYTVKAITWEKEKQLKEVMIIMGLDSWIHWAAWFARSLIMLSISTFFMIFVVTTKWKDNVAVLTFSSFTACYFFFTMYVINTIFFCFMMATMFSKANTASAVTGLVWFLTYLPYVFIDRNYEDLSKAAKLLLALSSNTAMGLGVRLIQGKELEGRGLQWNNMFIQTSPDEPLTIGSLYLMMIISSFLYMLTCLYLEQVFPGEYGLPKPWNFPFKKSFWVDTPEKIEIKNRRSTFKMRRTDSDEEIVDETVGIEIRNLYKMFGTKLAVNNLSLNMYANEITVLLGHNGAGKTTTIMILTGMLKPSAGTAIINGFDIRKDMEGARMSLGICPQHNVLFDDLTVENHLVFFSRLKGLRGEELTNEVNGFIEKIGLEKKAHLVSSKLSGGMKRRLSLCTAFCGGTKVVLCDEPSSGLDPAARRKLWEFIQSEKRGRTILLTTHFMDEAEVLGDHIAIMRAGQVRAYGTSFTLKKKYGDGYKLICEKLEGCDSAEVTNLLSQHIPDIQPTSDVGVELSYVLPEEYSSKFPEMLAELENNSENLHLGGYGIALTSLEDVFLKVGAEQNVEERVRGSIVHQANVNWVFEKHTLKTDGDLRRSQWQGMFYKKRTYTKNNKSLVLLQNLIPIIFLVGTIIAVKLTVSKGLLARTMSLKDYKNTVTCLQIKDSVKSGTTTDSMVGYYESYIKSLGHHHQLKVLKTEDFSKYIMDQGRKDQPYVDRAFIVAATMAESSVTAWFNNEPLHSASLSVNLIDNAMAKSVVGSDVFITVANKPLPYDPSSVIQDLDSVDSEGTQIALNTSLSLAFTSAFYVIFLVAEYETRAKLLQFVAGVNVFTFWFSHFIWDIATFTLTALIIAIILIASREPGYSTFVEISRYLVILFFFALSMLWFVYILAYFFDEPAVGFSRLTVFFFFTGNACMLIVTVLGYETLDTKAEADFLRSWFFFFPHFSMAIGFMDAYKNTRLHELCANFKEMSDEDRCSNFPLCCKLKSYYAWDEPGLLKPIVYLLVTAALFALIVLLREYNVFDNCWLRNICVKPPKPLTHDYREDDVEEEKEQIKYMTIEEIEKKNLVVDQLRKNFGHFIAVNGISFAVEAQQCFGLLGVNGAGKTTTFKMLTGDERISSGDAYVTGLSMRREMHKVYQKIGYCPQFDALFDYFTGEEMLVLFALIRGIQSQDRKEMAEHLALALGFSRHFNKQTRGYSGGNKRKLSVALAVIGNPYVVYLDEPTTGMDPGARRRFWKAICNIRDSGKSIILTTHSMDECEALCTRIAIMVNGEIKCMGSTQHLKNKFSQGLILKVQFESKTGMKRESIDNLRKRPTLVELEDSDIRDFTAFLKVHFPKTYLQDRYRRLVTFYIAVDQIPWSQLFDLIENNKKDLNIQDYTISQTTLEEIFLQIATYQHNDPREARLKEYQNRPSVFKKARKSLFPR